MPRFRVIWIVIIILLARSVKNFVGEGEGEEELQSNNKKDGYYDIFGTVKSMLKITNPQRIIQYYGSNFMQYLPTSLGQDLRVLLLVCHSNLTVLDLFQKELEVVNFTVHVPTNDDKNKINNKNIALRVGHFRIQWDSYVRPSIQIKVSDVDILVEFTNLLLTRTNWNELQDLGFPPKLLSEEASEKEFLECPEKVTSSSFIRIKSLDLTGDVRLHTQSRPLENKDIFPDLLFDLGMLDDLNNRIQTAAAKNINSNDYDNYYKDRKAGCTTEEFYEILEGYFYEKIQEILEDVTLDLMTNYFLDNNFEKSDVVQVGKNILKQIKRSGARYMLGVVEKTGSMLGEYLTNRLPSWDVL